MASAGSPPFRNQTSSIRGAGQGVAVKDPARDVTDRQVLGPCMVSQPLERRLRADPVAARQETLRLLDDHPGIQRRLELLGAVLGLLLGRAPRVEPTVADHAAAQAHSSPRLTRNSSGGCAAGWARIFSRNRPRAGLSSGCSNWTIDCPMISSSRQPKSWRTAGLA